MSKLKALIREAEAQLADAKMSASPPDHPRWFSEFEAFAASVRLAALKDAMRAVEAHG
jgi:hypothetical protein